MRRGQPRCVRWAAWLGVVALALNALVPIHIAFDVASAFGAASEHSLLAKLAGHHHNHANGESHQHGKSRDDGKSGRATACPVCLTLASLAGFAPVAAVALKPPTPAALPTAPTRIGGTATVALLAYRSRAPPIA